MKKLYSSIFICAGIFLYSNKINAQVNSITLTPEGGSAVNYASITSAYAAIPLNPPVNYTIEILAGYSGTDVSEVYPIQLTDKGLLPGGRTITIRPAAGANGKTIQRPVSTTGSVLQFNGGDNIILDGRPGGVTSTPSNYLTINNPFSGDNTGRNIEILNAANNNTIQFVNSVAADATAAGAGARNILVGSTTTSGNMNNTITNCVVTGGLRGIQDFGLSDAVQNSGTRILNNTVSNFGAIGIFAGSGQTNITIQNNTVSMAGYNVLVTGTTVSIVGIQQQSVISGTSTIADNIISINTSSSTVTGVSGIVNIAVGNEQILRNNIALLTAPSATSISGVSISSNTGTGSFNLNENTISNLSGNGATSVIGINCGSTATPGTTIYGITRNKIFNLSSPAAVNVRGMSIFPALGSTVNVNNNFVSITQANAAATAIFGILVGNTAGNNNTANIYYNSIRIGGTGASGTVTSYGIYRSDANSGSVYNQRNNIAYTERDGSSAFVNTNTSGTLNIDYNNYYGAGTANSNAAAWITTTYYSNASLAAYKAAAAPQEQNTTFSNVIYTSSTDLHLTGASTTDANLKGLPIAGITIDIDGDTRSGTAPFKGADEPAAPTPVHLFAFSGQSKGGYNLLTWSTASESNNKGFELQKSADGANFTAVGFINSKSVNGNSSTVLTYSLEDLKPFLTNSYYRLKQVDNDGHFSYSNIVNIKGKGVSKIEISNLYPNPVTDNFNLVISANSTGNVMIAVYDITGKVKIQKAVTIKSGDNVLNMNASLLSRGNYTISVIEEATGDVITTKFIK